MVFQASKLLFLYLIVTISLFLIIPCATQLTFNYSDFIETNNETVIITGNATISGSFIKLTPNAVENWDRATHSKLMHLWDKESGKLANFTTNFSFIIYLPGEVRYSDGLIFFLASPDFPQPSLTDGVGLGLVSRDQVRDPSFLSANKFVAVEFDTYRNLRWDPPLPVREHVGININNITSLTSTPWYCNIKENRTYSVSVEYDAIMQNLSVTFIGFYNGTTPIQQHLSSVTNLIEHLPEWVEFGFLASTSLLFESHILCTWSFQSTQPFWIQPNKNEENFRKKILVVDLSVGACILFSCSGLRGRRGRLGFDLSMDDEFESGTGPKKFSYNELVSATNNFAEEKKLGEGGLGGVYQGFLQDLNSYVAIKRVSRGSKQGIKEYASEVKSISHLDSHLFKGKSLLTWVVRYNIAQGLASALLYLHEEWEQCLGDFVLARLVDHDKGSQTTTLAGTMGYMAPECVISGRASKELDIYSFGVVALEIACGRKPINPNAKEDEIIMLEWVWELYGTRNLLKAADPVLCGDFDEQQMERLMVVGLWCAHPDSIARSSIRKAIHVLDFKTALPILEPKIHVPTYLTPAIRASTSSATLLDNHHAQSSSPSNYIGSSQLDTYFAASTSTSLLYSQSVHTM
ncbi:hypothetical protein ACJW30_07G082700 [Castanea mollissima]